MRTSMFCAVRTVPVKFPFPPRSRFRVMMASNFRSLVFIIEYLLVAIAAWNLAPYIMTAEHYDGSRAIHSAFPIAIIEDGKAAIIRWHTYSQAPAKYATVLLADPDQGSYPLADNERIELTRANGNQYDLIYRADNYVFWSGYSIVDGIVQPTYFRFTGAFIVMPVVLVALVGTQLLNWLLGALLARGHRRPASGSEP